MPVGSFTNRPGCKRVFRSLRIENLLFNIVQIEIISMSSEIRTNHSFALSTDGYAIDWTDAYIYRTYSYIEVTALFNRWIINLFFFQSIRSFIPPLSSRDNAQQWFQDGRRMVEEIEKTLGAIIQKVAEIIDDEVTTLKQLADSIRVRQKKNIDWPIDKKCLGESVENCCVQWRTNEYRIRSRHWSVVRRSKTFPKRICSRSNPSKNLTSSRNKALFDSSKTQVFQLKSKNLFGMNFSRMIPSVDL